MFKDKTSTRTSHFSSGSAYTSLSSLNVSRDTPRSEKPGLSSSGRTSGQGTRRRSVFSVFTKTLRDKRGFIIGWFVGFAALAALMVAFYPSMHQEGTIDQLVKTMPPAFKGLVGNLADLTRFDTYLASQLFDIRISLLAGIMATVLALGITVGEEEKGQLRTLLSLPISRTKLLLQKWVAMLLIIFVTLLGTTVSIFALQGTVDASIEFGVLVNLFVMIWLVIAALASVTFAVAIATGKRSLAMLFGILLLAGSFIVSTFGMSVDWLKDYEWLSLFHYFPASDVARNGIDSNNVIVLAGIALIALLVALVAFNRRDVN